MTRKQAPINYIRLRDSSERLVVQSGARRRLWRVERMEDLEVAPDAKGVPPLSREQIIQKFETFFEKPAEGCWVWTGGKNEHGYGKFNVNCGTDKAHRISWIIYVGPIPRGQHVLHRCDNPPCVRPDHLFIGTARDNRIDCKQKGRDFSPPHYRGEENSKAKLYERDVMEIRELIARGFVQAEIARRFNVTPQNIRSIRLRITWRHIP